MIHHTTRTTSTAIRSAFVAGATLACAVGGSTEPIVAPAPAPPSTSPWEFRIEPYGWLTAIDGDVGVRHLTGSVEAGFDDIWEVLDFAAALQLEVRNGRWGMIADGFYSDLSQSFTPPTRLHTNGNFEMQQFLGEFDLAYRFADSPSGFIDAYAGVRYNYLSADLTADAINPLIDKNIDLSQSKDWLDPLIGLRGQWNINDKWFLAGKGDLGGFSVGADLSWSLQATVGYHFTENVFVELGYRYLDTDYKDGGFTYDAAQAGLYTGLSIRF
jgi:opacity protein-like surface antigen